MGAVGVEEAAAVGAEHLDGFLRGDGTLCDGLLVTVCVVDLPSGPSGMVCGSTSCAVVVRLEILDNALRDQGERETKLIGRRTHKNERVRSTQKFPMVLDSWRAMPRITAMASAMPTAAEKKLWYASPAIWVR